MKTLTLCVRHMKMHEVHLTSLGFRFIVLLPLMVPNDSLMTKDWYSLFLHCYPQMNIANN